MLATLLIDPAIYAAAIETTRYPYTCVLLLPVGPSLSLAVSVHHSALLTTPSFKSPEYWQEPRIKLIGPVIESPFLDTFCALPILPASIELTAG